MTPRPQNTDKHVLLICSVGGTPEPIVAAIRHWRPARIRFIRSDQTRASVDQVLKDATADNGPSISPGCTDQTVLADPQDLERTLRELRPLDQDVRSWRERGDEYAVVVDFTGGTKVMSAALALIARRWKCTFAYIGGEQRNKEGVGVVVSGREKQIHQINPWDALGFQAVEDAVSVFNNGGYAAAVHLLDNAMKNAAASDVKRELATLKTLVDAYAAWDRFDHKTARTRFDDALKNRNDIDAIFADARGLIGRAERDRKTVAQLSDQNETTTAWVDDLLRNARRRAAEHRFDDAVARLYRACEALAQVQLRERHGIPDTGSVPLDELPDALQRKWEGRARDGKLFLGLRDAYTLLKALGDELGERFAASDLAHDKKSPLVGRNTSILAHGFRPLTEKAYVALFDAIKKLYPSALDREGADAQSWTLPHPRA